MNEIAPEMVVEFVAKGEAAGDLQALNMLHDDLQAAPLSPGTMKEMYDHMINHIARVLEDLRGQS